MPLPIKAIHSYEHYVRDLESTEKFYVDILGFKRIGKSKTEVETRDHTRRLLLSGGKTIDLILAAPLSEHSPVARYLDMHPDGIGSVNFRVSDSQETFELLGESDATFLSDPNKQSDARGSLTQFSIATPLDDVQFRFIEDSGYRGFTPSFDLTDQPGTYQSKYDYECIDHFTCNVMTLQPLMAFYREVMGFEEFWGIEFHTNDVNPSLPVGSGLKSKVMWHPDSGIKFANNEPSKPYFRNSQIDIYCRDNRGGGIQHVALRVPEIIPTVASMRQAGADFFESSPKYYETVMSRLQEAGFEDRIHEDMKEIEDQQILIDGGPKGYLLQIFCHEMNRQLKRKDAGALFYEVIQREGDDGFGGGNFRALFESIEVDQIALAKTAEKLIDDVI